MPALTGVTRQPKLCRAPGLAMKQRGVVLFFTLIALVVMSLAAVALIRSVDTSTMIAGNLAFRQSATSSGDSGIEAAIAWLSAAQSTMQANNLVVYQNATHIFNKTGGASGFTMVNPSGPIAGPAANGAACCQNAGYYSNADATLSLTNPNPSSGTGIQWTNADSTLVQVDSSGNTVDASGNTIRYVVQRMCRTANTIPGDIETSSPPVTGCLFASAAVNSSSQAVENATQVCQGAGCAKGGHTALMRITVKVTGPKNTVSYVQAIVY